jgi:hypothetical protein
MADDPNITATTRKLWRKTLVKEVILRLPLLTVLLMHRRMTFKGSKLTGTVESDTMTDLAQSYAPGEVLTGGSKTLWQKPEWGWKYTQLPVEYGVEAELQNAGAGPDIAPSVDIPKGLVQAGHYGMREKLCEMAYSTSATDDGKDFQSVVQALDHDVTYGGLSRATTVTNAWWQGVSLDGTYTDQDDAIGATIANVRAMVSICRRRRPQNERLYVFVGEELFQVFQAQIEAFHRYPPPANTAKFGFNAITLDNTVEFVQDSWLSVNGRTADFFIINPETWEFRVSPKRNFKMTDFKWLGEENLGTDAWLARILLAGNLVCWQPNANCWRSNMA